MITRDSRNILVADDSLFFRTKLSDVLIEAGHRVKFARNGNEVLDHLKIDSDGVDLLILDLQMPEVDGFGVLEWIKERGHHGKLPILALTGAYEATSVLERLKALGADGFMSKDMTPEQIILRVNRTLFPEKSKGRLDEGRVATSIPVDFTVEGSTITGFILNISENGAFLHTNVEIPEGTHVRLRFTLPESSEILDLEGTVKWSPEKTPKRSIFCGYGIEFLSMSIEQRERLKGFIASRNAKLRVYMSY